MTVTRWTPAFLDSMRSEMDPLADAVVADLFATGSVARVNQLMADLVGRQSGTPPELPPVVRDYLVESSELPDWMDPEQVKIGERIFGQWGVNSCAILACASLPECYLMKNGIHVLALTQRLQQHTRRRVLETAQMIMAVMFPGGVSPGGAGVRTAQKVRLMHAAIRFLIRHQPPPAASQPASFAAVLEQERWKPEFGEPINQEDLAFTLMTFSYVGVRSLNRLGASLTPSEQNAYIHTWNVVGYVMGIREDLLPSNFAEAEALYDAIKARQAGRTDAGVRMQAALLAYLEAILPAGPLKRLPKFVTGKLLDADAAATLGIETPSLWDRVRQKIVFQTWRMIDRDLSALYRRRYHLTFASAWLHDLLMAEIGRLPADWDHQLFGMPMNLLAELPPDWKRSPATAPDTVTVGLLSKL